MPCVPVAMGVCCLDCMLLFGRDAFRRQDGDQTLLSVLKTFAGATKRLFTLAAIPMVGDGMESSNGAANSAIIKNKNRSKGYYRQRVRATVEQSNLESRVEELESKLSFALDEISRLNKVVSQFQAAFSNLNNISPNR